MDFFDPIQYGSIMDRTDQILICQKKEFTQMIAAWYKTYIWGKCKETKKLSIVSVGLRLMLRVYVIFQPSFFPCQKWSKGLNLVALDPYRWPNFILGLWFHISHLCRNQYRNMCLDSRKGEWLCIRCKKDKTMTRPPHLPTLKLITSANKHSQCGAEVLALVNPPPPQA